MTVRTGLERLLRNGLAEIEGRRLGLVTNQTGIDTLLRNGIDLLAASDRFHLSALFGPEHGVRGADQAGVRVADAVDARTGLPVHSLYGATSKPTPAMLDGLEAMMFDIQDVGVLFATYVSTLWLVQEAGAETDLPVVILDHGMSCRGVQVHLLDRAALRPVELGIHLLHALKTHAPDDFGWHMSGRGAYFVDRLLGSDRPRLALDDGASAEEVFAGWDAQAAGFEERTRPHRLYA